MAGSSVGARVQVSDYQFRSASVDDIPQLVELEEKSFDTDRLTRRQFKWMISRANAELLLAEHNGVFAGYALVLFHRGTSLARLYSIAVVPSARGTGLADQLLEHIEAAAQTHGCIYLRLEVNPRNAAAIRLYERHGFYPFGRVTDYYEDHSDALRYEKRIYHIRPEVLKRGVPFYAQTTYFTCGPACLMMAMEGLNEKVRPDRRLEIQLWREATTVYMTSGHGGCSPEGLALAAWRRGFRVQMFVSQAEPLFLDGVRSDDKKDMIRLVHEDFTEQLRHSDVEVHYRGLNAAELIACVKAGGLALVLISSYRFNRAKTPHWVLLAAADERYVYIHDPEIDEEEHRAIVDNIYLPLLHEQFERIIRFGQIKARAAVVLYPPIGARMNGTG